MLLTNRERRLCQFLRELPLKYNCRYDDSAKSALLQGLFRSLAAEDDHTLEHIFKGALPNASLPWSLREAQGLVEGAEYSEGARGKRCGHIFKNAEAIYRCKDCEVDDTSVLCSHCFNSSEHTGHIVFISTSLGNGGCCDCGDPEAWRAHVNCAIHAADWTKSAGKAKASPQLPDELLESIRMTVGRTFDYMCDIISCSPEQLRLQKTEESVRHDERLSHLASKWYEEADDPDPEFALVLWNDEKHTVDEVNEQVARACKQKRAFGEEKANETNDIGRSVVTYSRDVKKLLKIAKIIEQIKITTTVRSSRDTFREQMCGTMIEWLQDIDGCSIGQDHNVLRDTICEEILKSWRTGSAATNSSVGKDGIDDHAIEDAAAEQRMLLTQIYRRDLIAGRLRPIVPDSDPDANSNDNDIDDGDDEADSQVNEDEMDIDLDMAPEVRAASRDLDMRTSGEPEDPVEISEATFAGYPPPPPPPPPPARNERQPLLRGSTSNMDSAGLPISLSSQVNIEIPQTPNKAPRKAQAKPPAYWLEQPAASMPTEPVAVHEDPRQRIRLDWLILYDLRLWKKARIDLRELYIKSVITVPSFKRILGFRFAGLYTVLSQLYLVADREPDHSIIQLSMQMLTTPSITEEIVERGNFLTVLIAILYTFLTRRQVGHPWEVSASNTLAFDNGSVTNRRVQYLFGYLKHVLDCERVHAKMRREERYAPQMIDLIRLPQGICPNVRAVGEHVEYETDAWIGASLVTRDVNKLCRVFAEPFSDQSPEELTNLSRVIRAVAKATVINATGAERNRFVQAEIKEEVRFKLLQPFDFEVELGGRQAQHSVVDFVVEKEPISFHHPLHYALSWLVGQGKRMSSTTLGSLLRFTSDELRESPAYRIFVPSLESDKYLLALFDYPLRVCTWLAQMKAGMWVRNGLSLRHQMSTYRGVTYRDLAHNRDILLLQTSMVVCNPSVMLASIIERFGMDDWMRGNYVIRSGFETTQQLDVAEDFIHLLIVILSDRTLLQPLTDQTKPPVTAIRRDLTHILCFKPLPFSELCNRLSDKATESAEFQQILESMTNYRAPEGLSDSGTFELKPEYLADVDPYIAHFSKNQRDEAENAFRTWTAKTTGKAASEIVLEPKLQPIQSGLFKDLAAFTRTMLFAQTIYYSLSFPLVAQNTLQIPDTRLEAFLQVVLHLMLAAILEEECGEEERSDTSDSFVLHALDKKACGGTYLPTIFSLLVKMLENEKIKGCHPKVHLIMHRLQQRRPRLYASAVVQIQSSGNASQRTLLDRLGADSSLTPLSDDSEAKRQQAQDLREAKKRQALDRQAKIMANFQQQQQNFERANQDTVDWGEDDMDDVESTATGATEEYKKMWKYPADNCLVCQEEVNDSRLYGTFALLMNSNIFRQTNLSDDDFVGEVLSTPDSLDRSAEQIRPFGLARRNRERVRKLTSNGAEVIAEHQGLGKGFPARQTMRGPVSTGCGHVMHYKCFETFSATTVRRQQHQIARNHPERPGSKEFVCPLCKALGNTFMPIIWKGKEEAFPGVLQVDVPFDEWLRSGIDLAVTRFQKHAVGEDGSRFKELFMTYTSKTIIFPLATKLMQFHKARPSSSQHANRSSVTGLQSMPGKFPSDDALSPPPSESVLMQELTTVYQRLRDTVKENKLSDRDYPAKPAAAQEDLVYTDTLARTLGYSITATEIAQRGIQSDPGMTLLDKIPSSVLTHLRILSETASSYIAVGGMRNSGLNRSAPEFSKTNINQLLQLFAGHPHIVSIGLDAWGSHTKTMSPALSQDPFVLLAECSVCLVPAFSLEIHHIVRLCFLMELVKAGVCLMSNPRLTLYRQQRAVDERTPDPPMQELRAFVDFLRSVRRHWASTDQTVYTEILARNWHLMVRNYALPFLRKVAILLHVRYGLDIPHAGFADVELPELERLIKTLRLPSLTELFASATEQGSIVSNMILGWINHWHWSQTQHPSLSIAARDGLKMNHPVIFELIGLPKAYDTLTAETIKRRCPTTGKELSDPVLCLFCGAIFCGQAQCCRKDDRGGCNQHQQVCGRNVGLFINVRKCNVLFLHDRNGSWHHAPYLDQYGEADPNLKHSRQLFLNQRRYDALLRDVWLRHGIPSMISRKLEADINNGGWETL
ncbi:MAG: hypothetical protein L6R37_005048 [Teloschistes peruensis]|nr:MAG: hypothetical protein L6R37_005048 [Teloschistes peruensis]